MRRINQINVGLFQHHSLLKNHTLSINRWVPTENKVAEISEMPHLLNRTKSNDLPACNGRIGRLVNIAVS